MRVLLSAEVDLKVVGEAATGRKTVQLTRKIRPDVVVMDLATRLINGFHATRQILEAIPGTRVIIFSAYRDAVYVKQVVEAGASGYVLKHTSALLLPQAVRKVQKGKRFLCPSIVKCLRDSRAAASEKGKAPRLSAMEATVLRLMSEGQSMKLVASDLGITIAAAEKHRRRLMDKLGDPGASKAALETIASSIAEKDAHVAVF